MRKLFFGIITVALTGLTACSSAHSITAPSPTTDGISINTPSSACSGPNCVFTATPFSGDASAWKGTTTANTAPSTGHHGILTVVFSAPFMGDGASTLSWSRFHAPAGGSKVSCTITNNKDDTIITLPSCADGSYTVHPMETTVYTFTDTRSDPPSKDDVQTATVTVTVPDTFNITATWQSSMGSGDDDPLVVYQGTATGKPTHIDANATSSTVCGMSGNRSTPADTFHATMAIVDATHITGAYEGISCLVDKGTFSLTKQAS